MIPFISLVYYEIYENPYIIWLLFVNWYIDDYILTLPLKLLGDPVLEAFDRGLPDLLLGEPDFDPFERGLLMIILYWLYT